MLLKISEELWLTEGDVEEEWKAGDGAVSVKQAHRFPRGVDLRVRHQERAIEERSTLSAENATEFFADELGVGVIVNLGLREEGVSFGEDVAQGPDLRLVHRRSRMRNPYEVGPRRFG